MKTDSKLLADALLARREELAELIAPALQDWEESDELHRDFARRLVVLVAKFIASH